MKLRTILLILAILSLLTASVGGFFLNLYSTGTAWEVARDHTNWTASLFRKQVTFYLEQHRKVSIALSGTPQLATALRRTDEAALGDVNALLDHQCASLEASVCYLMDAEGTTVASSNRDTSVSFVGKNYGFRPYFKEAIAGEPAVYLALGVTSKKRGLYFSAPVITSPGKFGGVVVVKFSIDNLESELSTLTGIFVLTDPKGIVFASNQKSWLYRSLSELSEKDAEAIMKSRQFGEEKPSSVGLIETKDSRVIAPNGTNYLMSKQALYIPAGWHITYLFDTAGISTQLKSRVGPVPVENMFLALFLVVAGIVFFLYRKAAGDIEMRNQAEAALRESEERFRAVVDSSPAAILLKDIDGHFLMANKKWQDWFNPKGRDFVGKTVYDFYDKAHADKVAAHDREVLETGLPVEREHQTPLVDGTEMTSIFYKFPVLGSDGRVAAIGGINSDITERKRTEEALRESEGRLRGAIDSLQEGFALFDADDRLVAVNDVYRAVNPKAQEFLEKGMRFEDLIRANVAEGRMVDAHGREEEFIAERVQQHRNPKDPILCQFNDGKWYLLKETRTPEGGIALTFTDITQLKTMTEARERLSLAVETVPVGIAIFDSDDRLVFFNSRYEELMEVMTDILKLGVYFEDMIRTMVDRQPVKDARGREEDFIRERVKHHRNPTGPFDIRRENGWLMADETRLPDGSIFTIITDITKQKQAEEDRRLALVEAEQANRAKSEFLANMSHELRTPLNSILGFSEMLTSEIFGPQGDPRYFDYASAINVSGTHLLQIISDILDLSKIEAGEAIVEDTRVDVEKTVRNCINMLTHRIKARGLDVEVNIQNHVPVLRADERHIKQIMINLLSNAIKFTPAGSQVTISARLNDNSGLEVSVSDPGIGIAAEDIPKVLQPFGQVAESFTRDHEGTGLGLPICKSLMELHDGSLTIASEVGKGTKVTIRFPPERTIQS